MKPVAVLFLIALASAQAEINGLQTVLLHCWDRDSINRFLAILRTMGEAEPFAISSAPYIAGCNIPEANRLDNLITVAQENHRNFLDVHFIVYLGGLGDSSAQVDVLGDRFLNLWQNLISKHQYDLKFVIGASFEDKYTEAEAEIALSGLIAKALTQQPNETVQDFQYRSTTLKRLIALGRLLLARSPAPVNTPEKPSFSSIVANGIAVKVLHESHGPKPGKIFTGRKNGLPQYREISGYGMWSNMDALVRFDCGDYRGLRPLKTETCPQCDQHGDSQSIDSFHGAKPTPTNFLLLWRPAYNVIDRPDLPFDSREQDVLARHLTGMCPPK